MTPPRIALATVFHESNGLVPSRTRLADFRPGGGAGAPVAGGSGAEPSSADPPRATAERLAGTASVTAGVLAAAAAAGIEVVPVLHRWATPSGWLATGTVDALVDELRGALGAAGPLDGMVLELHGAMAAQDDPAPDARLAAAARAGLGAKPLVAALDPHANLAPGLLDEVDALVAYQRNPHLDMAGAGERAVALLGRLLAGRPLACAAVPVPVLAPAIAQATADEPLAALTTAAADAVAGGAVLDASILFGYPYANVAHAGMAAVAVAATGAAAARVANDLAARAWELREGFERRLATIGDVVETARRSRGLTALTDTGDNVGAGAPGDSTVLLAPFVGAGLRVAGTLRAPAAAGAARAAGPGAELDLTLGTPPLALRVRVVAVADGRFANAGPLARGVEFDAGPSALLAAGGLALVLHSRPAMPNDPQLLRAAGVDVEALDAVVLKGAAAVRAGWAGVAAEIVDVDTPGPAGSDLHALALDGVDRPRFPLDDADWTPGG